MSLNRIVLSAGGTGGHIFPALAVADELRSRSPRIEILFIGGDKGPERRLAEKSGLRFVSLPARGVLGKRFAPISSFGWLIRSLRKCRRVIRDFDPEVVLGFGSYAAFMPVFWATVKGKTSAIHEQNAQPGLTNKILGKRVKRVFVSFPETASYFKEEKVIVTGNPVRKDLISLRHSEPHSKGQKESGHVLILGGSQGARGINDAILRVLTSFRDQNILIWHQTGWLDFDRVKAEYQSLGCDPGQVTAFIDNMATAYAWADIVVCRAGASTLTELAVIGKPSLLIPFPFAVNEHQLRNAKLMEKAGAAIVVEQKYIQDIDLSQMIIDLISVPGKLQEMALKAYNMGNPGAAEKIVDELEDMRSEKT